MFQLNWIFNARYFKNKKIGLNIYLVDVEKRERIEITFILSSPMPSFKLGKFHNLGNQDACVWLSGI